MKHTLFSLLLIFVFTCAHAQDCNTLPDHYSSYESAKAHIKAADFKIRESVNTSKSSWIRAANYYSCDGKTGYLIIQTDEKDYLHSGVPVEIWDGFKKAASFGSYYDHYIRKRYTFIL